MSDSPWPPAAPHSRACGTANHPHGVGCSTNCPTCHGLTVEAWEQYNKQDPRTSQIFPDFLTTSRALDVAAQALDSENEGIRLAAAQTLLRFSVFVRPNDESQAAP